MSRIAATSPVNARMYRHFAAITLAVTGLVALFADGESRQAIADEVESRETNRALREEQAEKHDFNRDLVRNRAQPPAAGGGWDSGGAPVDGDTGGSTIPDDMIVVDPLPDGRGAVLSQARPGGAPVPPVLPPGIPRDDYAFAPAGPLPAVRAPARRPTPEEQKRLLELLGDSETVAPD